MSDNLFSGHYDEWREKRVNAIVKHYTPEWFQGKTILELGCGYGDIGNAFTTLGAIVTYVEARPEHCDVLRHRFPDNRVICANLENEWPFEETERFDLILHLGVLYHIKNYKFALDKCFAQADNIVLETEVCDSDNVDCIITVEENKELYDQSVEGFGVRPSAEHIESLFANNGFDYLRVRDSRCNSGIHIYNWHVLNTRRYKNGQRRFWFVNKK